jgi:hypothetical protein
MVGPGEIGGLPLLGMAKNAAMEGAAKQAAKEVSPSITAYHASPYDFDRFDLSKIGTGVGDQMYTSGHYLAEDEYLAKEYLDHVTGGHPEKGHLYQVSIKAKPEDFLDWDASLYEQSPEVKAALAKFGVNEEEHGRWRGKDIVRDLLPEQIGAKLPANMATSYDPRISQALHDAGIPGIYHRDSSPKGGPSAGNYVVFDDKLLDVLKKYGIAGIAALPALGAYHFQDKDLPSHWRGGPAQRARGGRIAPPLSTRRESNYSPSRGKPDHHCGADAKWPHGACEHYMKPNKCKLVGGFIAAHGGCDWWKSAEKDAAGGEAA